jgi:peptidoglycan/xylan/chitin deacetylase (PgdA/CDA1 family)
MLVYHGVVGDDATDCWWTAPQSMFQRQIEYIYRHFTVVSLDEALEALIKKTKSKNLLVVTFDDGYRNVLENALPILHSLNMPCTIYLTTGPIQRHHLIWTDQLVLAFKNSTHLELDLSDSGLGRWQLIGNGIKRHSSQHLIDRLKTIPVERKNKLLKEIVGRLGATNDYSDPHPFQLLSIDEVKRLAQDHLVTIGSHTVNHEILTQLPLDQAVREISESKETLEQWIAKPIYHLAYPNGNYSEAIINEIKKLGFRSAATVGFPTTHAINPFTLERVGIGAWDDMDFFKCTITGITPLLHKARSLLSSLKS